VQLFSCQISHAQRNQEAKLMRLILENSQYEVVTLKSDLMALEFYIQLENLRMPISFNYTFQISENIDVEQVSIPPLLLQPFVENAIWHGLHPKKSPGNISISCSIDKNLLIFTIEDDGVGRNYIQDRDRIPGFKKESLGVKITEERIKILSQNSQAPAKVDFEDLFDTDRNPAGTRVHITIPFEV
jgi:sensor histidine kinase YesM